MLALQDTGDFLGMQSKSPLIAAIAVAVVLIAAAWSFYTVFVKAPIDLAQAAARGIKEVFSVTPRSRSSDRRDRAERPHHGIRHGGAGSEGGLLLEPYLAGKYQDDWDERCLYGEGWFPI